jgi:hypothetical protein
MAREPPPPGYCTFAQLARVMGVSRSAITQAFQNGRLAAYAGNGRRVGPDYRGKKWLRTAEAAEDWDANRVRLDNDYLARVIGRAD